MTTFDNWPDLQSDSCENIHSWISLTRGDLVFSRQDGIYGFKFPKKFVEVNPNHLNTLLMLITHTYK
jgi:hypothetical protein